MSDREMSLTLPPCVKALPTSEVFIDQSEGCRDDVPQLFDSISSVTENVCEWERETDRKRCVCVRLPQWRVVLVCWGKEKSSLCGFDLLRVTAVAQTLIEEQQTAGRSEWRGTEPDGTQTHSQCHHYHSVLAETQSIRHADREKFIYLFF